MRELFEKDNSDMRELLTDKLFLMRKVRFVAGICIVIWGLMLWFFGVAGFDPAMFFLVIFCETFINQPYGFVINRIRNLNWVILLHQIFDVALVTIGIHFIGGSDAYFAIIIYSLIIIFAGVIVTIKSSFLIAGLCCLGYLTMFNLESLGIVPKKPIFNFNIAPPLNVILLIFICMSLFLIAYVTSFLAKIIIKKSEESKAALAKLKFAEDVMFQAEKLAVVGQFATGIIHELKNPLGIILSGVEFLENGISDTEDTKHSLGKIKQSAMHANEIIKNILNFSRPLEQQLQIVDLNVVINDNIKLLKNVSLGHNIKIVREFSQEPVIVRINNGQFEELVFNVIRNASEAMPNGGRILIRTYRTDYQQRGFKSGFRESSRFVFGEKIAVLEIQDEGVGISEENMTKIFDPFFTTKHRKENAGLGLSICQRIIEAHKGEIEVKSSVGKGTILIIRLPLFEEKKRKIEIAN
ncbi:MAG: ATP-binding protein [Candidatus Omnitrophica bacterium]|nr:ATP-binding protein [Candidatus Omnitrophota bacterium]MDD5352163.1 ATP-binding protein [Candidatus Omnitrophota bacterium]MDD5549761.1 ATP-binding protein [Candidatus Omnitrophota bacterium]